MSSRGASAKFSCTLVLVSSPLLAVKLALLHVQATSKEEPITPAQLYKQQQDSERKPNLLEVNRCSTSGHLFERYSLLVV